MRTNFDAIDLLDVGFNAVSDARRVSANGTNPTIDTGTVPEDMWTGGGLYPWMTAATSLEAVSDSAADTAAGTGLRVILLQGLDASYNEVSQAVILNGLTPVTITTPLFRINAAGNVSAGSGGVNAGTVLIRDAGGGTTRAIMPVGIGQLQQSQFTVPAGWQLQINTILLAYNRVQNVARSASFAHFSRAATGFYRLSSELSVTNTNAFQLDLLPGPLLPEKTDFCIRCTFVADNGSNLSAGFNGVMRQRLAH